jgi:transcriptional regulator with XRE-family HTH domain
MNDDDGDLLKRFGQRVRTLRKKAGLSQEAFADKCGLDRTYVGGIERGERNIALRNIEVIARTLGLTLSKLMQDLDDPDNG